MDSCVGDSLITRITKDDVPVADGVPLSNPPADSVNPAGRVPVETDHAIGGSPDAANWKEYVEPTAALGNDGVVIARKGFMVSCNAALVVRGGVELSATEAVKLNVPVWVGIPVRLPALDNVIPDGNAPAVTDHEKGDAPPVAARFCE